GRDASPPALPEAPEPAPPTQTQQSGPIAGGPAEETQATDSHGDPLPPGAIARLGTVRFRHPFWVSGLAFACDSKSLASSCWDGAIRLWDPATGKAQRAFRPGKVDPGLGCALGVAISADRSIVVSLENGGSARVWDLKSGKKIWDLKGRNGFGLALSPDGK